MKRDGLPPPGGLESASVYTIGHSDHASADLIGLLLEYGIELLADVRSSSYSRYAPQANREPLARALALAGLTYRWMGERLGGKPQGKGLPTSPVSADRFPLRGSLAAMTAKDIRAAIDRLQHDGLLESFEKGDYRLLRITESGKRALAEAAEQGTVPARALGAAIRPSQVLLAPEPEQGLDAALFAALRAWRTRIARQLARAPFLILPEAVLRAIAYERPYFSGCS